MVKIMHDSDADASILNGKTVAAKKEAMNTPIYPYSIRNSIGVETRER